MCQPKVNEYDDDDDDDGLPRAAISSNFRRISQTWEATTAKRMKIDPYY